MQRTMARTHQCRADWSRSIVGRKFALLVTSMVFLNCIFLAIRQPMEPEVRLVCVTEQLGQRTTSKT